MTAADRTLRRCQFAALIAAAVGVLGCVGALVLAPDQFWPGYHVSFLFWWQITIGSLGLALLRCVIRSNWGNATWPYLKSSLATVPWTAALFLPIFIGLSHIFPWARQESEGGHHVNSFQVVYFARWFFAMRTVGYFAIWQVASYIAARSGTSSGDARLPRRLSAFALIGLVMATTFAAFDWGMSLEPEWYSTIYGAMILVSGAVAALAVLIVAVTLLVQIPQLPKVRMRQIMNDLGNLLLAFLMIWSYFAFSQYLIIWSGNLPAEVTWYLRRSAGSWQVVLLVVVLFHFIVPFFLLLSREHKQNPRRLATVALILLAANAVQSIWTYAPAFFATPTALPWSLLTSMLAIGGCWTYAYSAALASSLRDKELMRSDSHD